MPQASYILAQPSQRNTSVVFSSPHSGRDYSPAFLRSSVLDSHVIRSSEDAFVEQLVDSAPELGAPLLMATAPRAYIDLNRATEELDPALIDGVRKLSHNPRVASGLGVIPRVVAGGRAIYRGKLSRAEAEKRIARHWVPYHGTLRRLITESCAMFGEAILVDIHSMPHEAIESIARGGSRRPEVVIGDRFGASASSEVVDRIEAAFTAAGLHVVRNSPFAGAFIVQHYGRPARDQHAVQIEIDRSLYMDEEHIRPRADFDAVRGVLRQVVSDIVAIGQRQLPLAAE